MNKLTEYDKTFKAIERLISKHIVCFHTEANRYAFKIKNKWHTLDMEFVDLFVYYKY